MPQADFAAEVQNNTYITLLFSLAVIIITLYLVTTAMGTMEAKLEKLEREANILHYKASQDIGTADVEENVLEAYAKRMKPLVFASGLVSWQQSNKGNRHPNLPVTMTEMRKHFAEKAVDYVRNARKGRNIVTMCNMELFSSSLPLFVYKKYTSKTYQLIVHLFIIGHILLQIALPTDLTKFKQQGYPPSLATFEFFCILVEILDFAIYLTLTYRWRSTRDLIAPKAVRRFWRTFTYASLLFIIFIDWCVSVSPVRFRLEYVIPLRWLILVLRNRSIRQVARTYILALLSMKNVGVVYICAVIVSAIGGVILFKDKIVTTGLSASYANFLLSLINTIVYFTSGACYAEVVPNAIAISSFYIFFYVIMTVVGTFILGGMIIGAFSKMFRAKREEDENYQNLYARSGMIAAFLLLDINEGGQLDQNEFESFMRILRPELTDKVLKETFKEIDCKGSDQNISLDEFIKGLETLWVYKLLKVREKPKADLPEWRQQAYKWQQLLRTKFVDTQGFANGVLFLVLLNFWITTLYGTLDADTLVDNITATILLLYVVEMILKIAAFGWDEFWNYNDYNPGRAAKMKGWANNYDLVVIVVSFIAFIVAHSIAGSYNFNTQEFHSLRAFAALPVLRIFSVVEKVRDTMFGVFVSSTAFIPVFCLLLLIFYCYSVVGTFLFARDNYYYNPGDLQDNSFFDHFKASAITLFQVLTGQNWDLIMYAHMFTYGFGAAWFFMSFVIFVGLLYVQLVIGMVVDGYLDSIDEEEKEKEILQGDDDDDDDDGAAETKEPAPETKDPVEPPTGRMDTIVEPSAEPKEESKEESVAREEGKETATETEPEPEKEKEKEDSVAKEKEELEPGDTSDPSIPQESREV